ncbi:beta-phosphoglucomutase [Lentilactobacillus buchneri]|uniref:Beta-phosphoglucomutase n=1 Tax=Lentilactobacillus buchneri DSM 20057 TaxID=1423728 RepID=A0A4R5NRU7_LENBU|nr:beta-phosphoglucomutase [Lentilactobacillus buchneri]WCJ52524.1 beta-phosphoglucomutase [Lentilactobacillus sp. Egmn17]AEB74273.1 beta-phosphoglucomutase [Lentilactobacillus buchneri NRRL B-30929]MCT2881648.1 beta-phosphoglucomutase [Lentilactobacillus buchneri]MCT2899081.1 beta-phosphoglucomutase [Lentilactobacillus buchneri]MCT3253081.1 beta-phosphoglucomutase [Lentilactobacillus buchneri]
MTDFTNIKGVLFDLNGIITDSWRYHSQSWRQIAEEIGVQWNQDLEEAIKGRDRIDSLNEILRVGGLVGKYSDQQKEALADKKNAIYQQMLEIMNPDDILPGIRDFLAELRLNHYQMIIASASANAPKEIHKLELEDYFPLIVNLADIKHNKPAPDVYLKAAEMLHLNVDQCIGIDDGIVGVESINAANVVSIGVGDPEVLTMADINFESTKELTLANIRQSWPK